MVILVPIGFLLAPPDLGAPTVASAATSYSYENLFKPNTVLSDRARSYAVPNDVRDMATGDLNNDGDMDVVIATGTRIIIYYGSGEGALGNSFTLPLTMSDVRKIAVGDLDRDGNDDIAATYIDASNGFPRVGIFYQKDSFSTSSDLQLQTYPDPWQVLIGDFSNSGSNGLAVICRGDPGNGDPAVLMLLRYPYTNLGDRKYVELSGSDNLRLLASGHVNADGRVDLVAGDAYGSTIVVLTQPASFSTSWSPATKDIGGSIADLQFIDYYGTGTKKDLVLVKHGLDSNQVEVRINQGSIPTSASGSFSLNGASSLSVGRVTGASADDLIVLSNSEGAVKLFPHHGAGFDPNVYFQFPVNTGPVKAVATGSGLYVLSSGGAGAGPTVEFYPYLDSSIGNADGNRFLPDGQPTVVCGGNVPFGIIAAAYDGQNAVYISTLSGAIRTITTLSVPTSLYIGDLDGDSIGDLAIGCRSSNVISIFKGSSEFMSNNQPVTVSLPLTQPQSLTGGRIDAIGQDVLIVGCRAGIDVIYGPLSGSPVHEAIGTGSAGDRTDVAFGRLSSARTNDGIAALNSNTGSVELFYLRSSPSIGDCYDPAYNARLSMSGYTPTSMAIGDFDGNGADDVAVTTTVSQLRVFYNVGLQEGIPSSTSITLPGASGQVRSADLNDDGKDDLAVRYSSIARIGIWLSRGSLSFSNPFNMSAGGIAGGIFVGEINGDQRADILASSSTADAVSYWFQRNLAPNAEIWRSSTTINMGEYVSFDASNCTDSASDLLTYEWNFGDDNSSTQLEVQHQYTDEGLYNGYLLVTDRSGVTVRVDFQVRVNHPMVAIIAVSKYSPLMGETISLGDISDVPNGVLSRFWDLGDKGTSDKQSLNVTYDLPGYYNITLSVTDKLGNNATTNITIVVLRDSTTIDGIIANGGETIFFMDEQIFFEIITRDVGAPVVGIEWDMDYDDTKGFTSTPGSTINRTTWTYTKIGEHEIRVRYTDEPFVQKFLTIDIVNARPVADISASSVKPGNYTFDAGKSTDTPTHAANLTYRWNFGDGNGWTAFSKETRVQHNYSEDGMYAVFLEVKDEEGLVSSATYYAVVDNGPPVITMDKAMLSPKAYRGEDLIVKATVTDVSEIGEVRLVYTTGNETRSVLMSRVSGTDTYVATVPAADIDESLVFHVVATDADGYSSESAAINVSVLDRPDNTWIYILVAALATIAALFLLYYRTAAMVVDEVFVIYQDGNLMAHQTRRLKPGMDDHILGSMLVAIQEFVRDSFKDEASTGLSRMDFGEKKVLVEKGEHIYLAVVLHGKREGNVPQRMRDTISRAESDYSQVLDGWDGDLDKVRGIKGKTDDLLKIGVIEMVSAPFKKDSGREPVDMAVCSYCEAAFPADAPKCPRCGTTLGAEKGRSGETVDRRKDSARPL